VAVALVAVLALARAVSAPTAAPRSAPVALLTVDARGQGGTALSPALFGVGVDLASGSYVRPGDAHCVALANVQAGSGVALVRIGARAADDYDWPADTYYNLQNPRLPIKASPGCPAPGPAASVLRVLDRVRALHARAVVVLNGETDDPRAAYGLVTLIARRFGDAFARAIYWEIGNEPAEWQHFGVPLTARRGDEHILCTPDQYAAVVTSYAAAITAALGASSPGTPSDKAWPRVVADAWIANATDQSWAGLVTAVDARYYPYMTTEPASQDAIASGVVSPTAGAVSLDDQLSSLRDSVAQYDQSGSVRLFIGQWNVDANADPSAGADFYASYGQAVFVADLMLHLARHGGAMAAWAPPFYGAPQAPFASGQPSPGYAVLTALATLAGSRLLATPTVPPGLDALAARRPDGGLSLVLVRTSDQGPADTPLRIVGGPARPVHAMIQTFSATDNGVTRALILDPANARVVVPTPGVVIVTLPAR